MAKPAKRPTGRPSSFTQAVADQICQRMATGQTLREICRADDMPDRVTVWRWKEANETFRNQYDRAREALVEHWADEIVEIGDDGTNDWMARRSATGGGRSEAAGEAEEVVPNHEHVNRSKLRIDSRKWLMSKLLPKKYGDKVELEHSGSVQTLSDADLDARLAKFLGKAGVPSSPGREGETEG